MMDSNIENPDLEDGEIEDDEEDQITIPKAPNEDRSGVPSASCQTTNSRAKNDKSTRGTVVDDDFAGKIESMIAIVLKKDGIEPPLPEIVRNQEKENCSDVASGQRQSKRKKRADNYEREREKKKKLDKSIMEAEEDEFEFLCVRGASPPPMQQQQLPTSTYPGVRGGANDDSYESDYSGSSYDSYNCSPDRLRVNAYTEKRNRGNRDRGQRGQRGGQKEKHHNKRHQSRAGNAGNGQNDAGLDSDDERNRKMELCKFYLMDCCAKRDKCLYMHSDFPCKYHYLGIRCVSHDKGTCKFLHGAPLSDNLRSILLKHLETAPKEILGDFPRLSRDNSIKMLESTNQKLMIEYGMIPKPVMSASNSNNPVVANKIPSLLEINIAKPASLIEKEEQQMNKSLKPRRTRWCAPSSNSSSALNSSSLTSSAPQSSVVPAQPANQTKSFLSLKLLKGVLSQTQIENIEVLGIETLEQVNQLTVAQLNDLGLTVDQIRAIQLNAMNIQKLGLLSTPDVAVATPTSTTTTAYGDLDMRTTASIKTEVDAAAQSDSDICLNPCGGDVDMRVLPIDQSIKKSPKSEEDAVIPHHQSTQPTSINTDYSKFIISPPSSIDYSKYLKDSNLENILENNSNSDSEEDENLKIDDELLAAITVTESSLPSMTSPPIIPPVCLTTVVPTKIVPLPPPPPPVVLPVPSETSATPAKSSHSVTSSISSTTTSSSSGGGFGNSNEITRIDFYNPRLSPTPTTTYTYSEELPTITLPPITTPASKPSPQSTADLIASGQRITMYDRVIEDLEQEIQIKSDRDMRLQAFIHESSDSNGDVDFRLPFKPIPNYVPATEIDASFTSHNPIEYKLVKISIPKPDYSDIRRSFPVPHKTLDPRLRRIFALKELSDEKSYHDMRSPTDPFQSIGVTSPIDTGPIMPRLDPRADPRRKKDTMHDNITHMTHTTSGNSAAGNKSLDIQIMLQNSLWYRDLSSKQKMSVNQHLATLSSELKQFNLDPNPDKKFDTNLMIQQTLTNLGVYVNESGDFIELCDNTGMVGHTGIMMNSMVGGHGHKLPPNHMMNLMNMQGMDGGGFGMNGPNFNPHHSHSMNQIQMFPPKQFVDTVGGGNIRPGLLGIAPNMPFNNYDSNLAFQQQTLQFEEFIDNNINNNRFDRGDGGGGGGGNRNFNRNNTFRGGNMRNNDRWRNSNMNRNNNNNMQRRPMYDRDNRRHD